MKHIKEEYGMETNLLTLTNEEFDQLEPFLKALGIRCRYTQFNSKECTIQAENPYKFWIDHPDGRKLADKDMTEFSIACFRK